MRQSADVLPGRRESRIDPSLIDLPLQDEVDLLMRLIAAANDTQNHLDLMTLDAILFAKH